MLEKLSSVRIMSEASFATSVPAMPCGLEKYMVGTSWQETLSCSLPSGISHKYLKGIIAVHMQLPSASCKVDYWHCKQFVVTKSKTNAIICCSILKAILSQTLELHSVPEQLGYNQILQMWNCSLHCKPNGCSKTQWSNGWHCVLKLNLCIKITPYTLQLQQQVLQGDSSFCQDLRPIVSEVYYLQDEMDGYGPNNTAVQTFHS